MRDRVLAAVGDAASRVLVGSGDGLPDEVRVTREDPPGGGPVAATAAGLALLDPDTTVVALLAADLPLLTRAAIGDLLTHLAAAESPALAAPVDGPSGPRAGAVLAPESVDGVCFVDADGRRQSLCGVWRVDALRTALAGLAAERDGGLAGAAVRALMARLVVREVPWVGAGPPPWFDCDTDEDVRRARELLR